MNDAGGAIAVKVHAAIAEIPATAWDACAGDGNPSVAEGLTPSRSQDKQQ